MSKLPTIAEKYILHWGEMGTRWGINRTVAQTHALLYLSPKPLHSGEIAETLSVARSNVSTSLRELQSWGLVRVVHILGDRRDHFESVGDVWEMFRVIIEERKRREIDPTLAMLRSCIQELQAEPDADIHLEQRLAHMLEFFESTTSFYEELKQLPAPAVRSIFRIKGLAQEWVKSLVKPS